MGEAQYRGPNYFPDAFYSARLLWKVLSQTKVIVSVLKAEKGVRRRVSVRSGLKARTREWVDNDCRNEEKHDEKTNLLGRKKSRGKAKTGCYLCKLHHTNNLSTSTLDLPYTWPSHPSNFSLSSSKSQESLTYLPITRSQPPAPPRRSTSLPYYKILKQLKRLQVVTGPHCLLGDLRLPVKDGWIWTDIVASVKTRDTVWKLLLQVSHEQSCIRDLVLAVGASERSRSTTHGSQFGLDGMSVKFCFQGLRKLRIFLSHKEGGTSVDSRTLDVCFLATYLLTSLHTLLGNRKVAVWWKWTGYKVLKGAIRSLGSEEALSDCVTELALAFGRLDLR